MSRNNLFTAALIAGIAACQAEIGQQQTTFTSPDVTKIISALSAANNENKPNNACLKTLFHCKTRNGKEVFVCDAGKTLYYSFGMPGAKAELSLSIPRERASTSQWKGIGRWIYYSVTIPNGHTNYSVFTSLDRMSESHDFDAGVSVTVGDEEIARIDCVEPIVHQIEGVDLQQE